MEFWTIRAIAHESIHSASPRVSFWMEMLWHRRQNDNADNGHTVFLAKIHLAFRSVAVRQQDDDERISKRVGLLPTLLVSTQLKDNAQQQKQYPNDESFVPVCTSV